MAGSAFEETLAGFGRWAGTTERKLSGDPQEVAAELSTVFSLMPDYLGIDTPSELTAALLNELLLDVYPRKVTVIDREDVASTVPALRDLTSYLADTGAITATAARAMDQELDKIEPDFADAVMDPANWGPATAMMHAMHRDGVNVGDSASVDAWIAQQNGAVFPVHSADPISWDGVDLKEAFGLPEVVAPVRLPDDKELTALAGAAPLLAELRGLARDVRETEVRAATVDPLLLNLAVACELVDRDDDALMPGDDVCGWTTSPRTPAPWTRGTLPSRRSSTPHWRPRTRGSRRPARTWTSRATVSPWSWTCSSARGPEFPSRGCPRA
jgi:hypothetical protein